MRQHGYDGAHPIAVWGDIPIDGNTRLKAAQQAGLTHVPVIYRSFASEEEALKYAIHCQRDRRNLTDADILRLVEELDHRRTRGGDRRGEGAPGSKTSGEVIDPLAYRAVIHESGSRCVNHDSPATQRVHARSRPP